VPTLRLFDGRPVDDDLRSRADSTVSFDIQKLTELCINEARLSALQSLIEDTTRPEKQWLSEVQRAFGFTTLESLGMNQSDIDACFDKMRAVAVDFRERQQSEVGGKWANVYSTIETIQRRTIDDFSAKIQARAQKIQSPQKVRTRVASPSPFKLIDSAEAEQTPPTQMKPSSPSSSPRRSSAFPATPPRIIPIQTQTDGRWIAIRRLHDRQKLHRIVQTWRALAREPPKVSHLGRVFEMGLKRSRVAQKFHFWKCQGLSKKSRYGADHYQLLEQAQDGISRIAELECELEREQKLTRDVRAALEQSVKNEGKMRSIIKRMNRERALLEKRIHDSERKYEDDVLQFMLESRFKYESSNARAAELEQTLATLESEKAALNALILKSQAAHRREVDELQARLRSAFEVTPGLRRETSKLKAELESPAEFPSSPKGARWPRGNAAEVEFPLF
jgi:DNA repair exonuclease SbcCD ATPase subunit